MVTLYLKRLLLMDDFHKAHKAYVLACDGISIKENEKVVLKSKTTWSYDFAKGIKGADTKAHEQVILELNQPHYSYFFARDIPGANIEEHFKVILNSGDKTYLDAFIKYVNYKNTKVEEWILYI